MRGGIKGEAEGEWNEDANFEYCWKKASGGGGGVPSAAVKIPGHQSAKPVSKSPKSPRSPKSPKSPGTLSSHKKSPMSDLVALSDASLKEMKDALLNSDKRCQYQMEIEEVGQGRILLVPHKNFYPRIVQFKTNKSNGEAPAHKIYVTTRNNQVYVQIKTLADNFCFGL